MDDFDFEMGDETMLGETPLSGYEQGSFENLADHFGDPFDALIGEAGSDGFDGFDLEDDLYENSGDPEDPFLGKAFKGFGSGLSKILSASKQFAPQIATLIGGALGGPAGAALGGKLGSLAKQLEGDEEMDSDEELNAASNVSPVDDSLSESLADTATRLPPALAQSMGSAITVTLASRAPLPVKAVLPILVRASGDIARSLAATRDPRVRQLIRALPTIQKRTIATLDAKARAGKAITPRTAVRVMRRQSNRILTNPKALGRALATNTRQRGRLDRAAIARAERYA